MTSPDSNFYSGQEGGRRKPPYKGTYGDNAENIPDALKGRIKMPRNDSQLKHIFREDEGHLPDTPENRKLISDLANDCHYYVGKDKYGNDWHVRLNEDGTQDWVRHQNMVINEGGRNIEPKPWNPKTGLYKNIWEDD